MGAAIGGAAVRAIRVGCAGWSEPGWVGPFYAPGTPAGEWLRAYARVFDFVEVNASYYRAPSRDLVATWSASTPAGFAFAVKLPKSITYDKRLRDADDEINAFLRALEPLRATGKLAAVVAVMEPSFRRDAHAENLDGFLRSWPRSVRLAVELRDPSWWIPATYEALEAAGAAHVWATTQYGRTPAVLTTSWGYARLIGDRALDALDGFDWSRKVRDQSAEVAHWAAHVDLEPRLWSEFFFTANNHFEGFGPATAAEVAARLGLPPLDLAKARRASGQRALF